MIKDYPDFQKERLALLHAIRQFALLPDEVKTHNPITAQDLTSFLSEYRISETY